MVNLSQLAAMFGLDARIALAIFGALSVITGAALYSSIQKSKVIAVINDMSELTKAYESYILDTGKDLSKKAGGSPLMLEAAKLREDTSIGWKGPYVNYKDDNTGIANNTGFLYPRYPDLGGVYLIQMRDDFVWNIGDVDSNVAKCVDGVPCYMWTEVFLPTDIATAIDVKIDGVRSSSQGRVKIIESSSSVYFVYIKQMVVNI